MFRLPLLMKEVTYRPVPLERRVRRDMTTERRKPNGTKLPHENLNFTELGLLISNVKLRGDALLRRPS